MSCVISVVCVVCVISVECEISDQCVECELCDQCIRLYVGLKRVTLVKDPDKGIGCTIKNAAGHILVNRIVEDGPIAITGVLRPGMSSQKERELPG